MQVERLSVGQARIRRARPAGGSGGRVSNAWEDAPEKGIIYRKVD